MPKDSNKNKIKLEDARKVSGATGLPIQKPRTGEYDYEIISNIVKAAKETGLGNEGENVGQVDWDKLKKNSKRFKAYESSIKGSKDEVYNDAKALTFMLKMSKEDADLAGYIADESDEAQRLQAYNGYGKVGSNNDIGAKQLYGIDLTKNTIDMAKTPLYGKTIVDIRDNVIKNNPDIKNIVDAYSLPDDELIGLEALPMPTVKGRVSYQFKKGKDVIGNIDAEQREFTTQAAKSAYLRSLYLQSKQKK